MNALLSGLIRDWLAEAEQLELLLAGLSEQQWGADTPAVGWTVKHQVQHLVWTEQMYVQAITEPDEFQRAVAAVLVPGNSVVDDGAAVGLEKTGPQLLADWRVSRAGMAELLEQLPGGARIPWIGASMGAASAATARLMETFAHGQDVRDTFGVDTAESGRLKHIAHLAVKTMPFNYRSHGLTLPEEPVLVELTCGDETWRWGESAASPNGENAQGVLQSVRGPALDFVLLAVRRRHFDDLDLVVQGADARQWLEIIQTFAGPPGESRQPLQS